MLESSKFPMQPKLFEKTTVTVELETVILYALGEFQSRGKVLADRELAYDRLRGAFLRAFSRFGMPEPSEEVVVKALERLGARVTEIPKFVAKRPFRIFVSRKLARESEVTFQKTNGNPE